MARVVALVMALAILQGSMMPLHPFQMMPLYPLHAAGLAGALAAAHDHGYPADAAPPVKHDWDGHGQCDDHFLYHMLALVPLHEASLISSRQPLAPRAQVVWVSLRLSPPSPPPIAAG